MLLLFQLFLSSSRRPTTCRSPSRRAERRTMSATSTSPCGNYKWTTQHSTPSMFSSTAAFSRNLSLTSSCLPRSFSFSYLFGCNCWVQLIPCMLLTLVTGLLVRAMIQVGTQQLHNTNTNIFVAAELQCNTQLTIQPAGINIST